MRERIDEGGGGRGLVREGFVREEEEGIGEEGGGSGLVREEEGGDW